jgi:prepilin-type N-terminal cleavage/methylation domain-containing protein
VDRGFTLIEIVVVMTIIFVLVAALGWKSSAALSGEKLSSAAEQIKADIRYTQAFAMGQRTTASITWTNGGSTYAVSISPSGLQTKRLTANVTFNTPSITSLSFNSIGEPTGACAASVCTIQLQCLGATKTVTINPYTGYAG